MKNYYTITIPKPCHEDWNAMTPTEKGKFCKSCSKTVVDFTKLSTYEIQDFIHENKNNAVCGHFKQTQLDSINIRVPSQSLLQPKTFHKTFFLALLIAMGTTLFNCTNKNGNKQKIDSVEVIDTTKTSEQITFGEPLFNENDSILDKNCSEKNNQTQIQPQKKNTSIEKIKTNEIPEIEGEIILGLIIHETSPQFKDTPENLSNDEKKDYFQKNVSNFISENFNTSVCLDLKGIQKIQTSFKINEDGYVTNINTKAANPILEKEAKRVLELLPQFIPAKQGSKSISTMHSVPIFFRVEE